MENSKTVPKDEHENKLLYVMTFTWNFSLQVENKKRGKKRKQRKPKRKKKCFLRSKIIVFFSTGMSSKLWHLLWIGDSIMHVLFSLIQRSLGVTPHVDLSCSPPALTFSNNTLPIFAPELYKHLNCRLNSCNPTLQHALVQILKQSCMNKIHYLFWSMECIWHIFMFILM